MPRALRLALYLLVADGLVALHLAELLGPTTAAVVVAGLLASWWGAPRVAFRPGFERALVLVAALAALADVLVVAEAVLDGLVRFLLFLVLFKLFTLRTVRDTRTVAFLAFFMLAAAASSAFGVGFLFVLVLFLGLGSWLMLLQTQAAEAEPAPDRTLVGGASALTAVRGLAGVALAASTGAIVVTALFFFVIPRVGLTAVPFRLRTASMVTGFTDRVELGAYGEIEIDSTVVMRVHVPEWTREPARIPALRWRGVVLDHFDGRAWTARHPQRASLQRPGGDFLLGLPRGTGRILVQDIYLEPLSTAVLFAAPRPLALRLRVGDTVTVDDMGSVAAPGARSRLRYTVVSEVERVPPLRPNPRHAPPLDPERTARYLQLPPLPARIAELARQVTAGSADPYDAAQRLTSHLLRDYRYTLLLERWTTLDPVDEFLFVRRAGNCEYFAAALAVMLRSVGVPARVVNGFQRGEWNPYGHYFMVRLRDAHSWVEAYVAGVGWVTLDPSPRSDAELEGSWGALVLYLDSLRMRWHRYVVNWSFRDQLLAAWTIRQHAGGVGASLAPLAEWRRGLAIATLLVLAGWLLGRRRWRPGAARAATGALPRFYARALAALARRGLRPAPGETAREFAGRVAEAAPACAPPLRRLTVAYERDRFGAAPPGPAELAELDASVTALDRSPGS